MKRVHGILILILAIFTLFAACKDPAGGGGGDDYTVTFDKNHSDSSGFTEANPTTKKVISPATTVGTLPTAPTRKDYTFQNWNTAANGSGSAFTESTAVTKDITVYAKWEPAATGDFSIVLENSGEETGDSVSRSPARADAGDTITINYTLANTKQNNRLTFSGTTETISEVDQAGTGTRTYTVDADDADTDGIIRITATFIHTNKEIDTIAFTEPIVNKKYGDPAFIITVSEEGEGDGDITYSSSNAGIATVDEETGEVTIVAVGSCTITATKEEDETYAEATASYNLIIGKGTGATLTGTLTAATNGITVDTIEITAVTAPANGQTVEYAIAESNNEPVSGWHHNTTFTELNHSTTYYIFARAAENDNYAAGTAISGTFMTATPSTTVTKVTFQEGVTPGVIYSNTNNITATVTSENVLRVNFTGSYNNNRTVFLPFNVGTAPLSSYSKIAIRVRFISGDITGGKTMFAEAVAKGTPTTTPAASGSNLAYGSLAGNPLMGAANSGWKDLEIPKTSTAAADSLTGDIYIGFYINNTGAFVYEIESIELTN